MTKHAIAAKSLLKKWMMTRPLNMQKKSSPFQKNQKNVQTLLLISLSNPQNHNLHTLVPPKCSVIWVFCV